MGDDLNVKSKAELGEGSERNRVSFISEIDLNIMEGGERSRYNSSDSKEVAS